MDKPYRRYGDFTYFKNNADGTFTCTHGGWSGDHVDPASLDVGFKVIEYPYYVDLTEQEYEEQFHGNPKS